MSALKGEPVDTVSGKVEEGTASAHCLTRIRRILERLRPAERRVAEYVLAHPRHVVYSSITETAENSGSSEATVIRFCRRLQLRGYQEFKIALARDLVEPEQYIHSDISPKDDIATTVNKVYAANIAALKDTRDMLKLDEVARAIDYVDRAQHVHIFGSGTSGVSALDVYYKLVRIGVRVSAYPDTHQRAAAIGTLHKSDVVLAISRSGSTRDVVDAVEMAKLKGLPCIAITNRPRSPLSRLVDVALVTAGEETPFGGSGITSILTQLSILDALFVGLAMRRHEDALVHLNESAEAIKCMKY